LCKNVEINVPSKSERTCEDWNIACDGILTIDRESSTCVISSMNTPT
jgi:hypothetical protein